MVRQKTEEKHWLTEMLPCSLTGGHETILYKARRGSRREPLQDVMYCKRCGRQWAGSLDKPFPEADEEEWLGHGTGIGGYFPETADKHHRERMQSQSSDSDSENSTNRLVECDREGCNGTPTHAGPVADESDTLPPRLSCPDHAREGDERLSVEES